MSHTLSLAELTASGAHQSGHFLLSSGLHSGDYLQCALYLAHPAAAETAGRRLAAAITEAGLLPQLVVAPALGGLIIGHEVARALGLPFLFTERQDGRMQLRRGFAVGNGQQVVIIEDVVTTGSSTKEVVAILQAATATVIGVASMINRTGRTNPFAPLPYRCLLSVDLPTWTASQCPLCQDGTPIQKPGSRPIGQTTRAPK